MYRRLSVPAIVAGILLAVLSPGAAASVVLMGTRVIYDASAREVTLKLANEGQAPALIQAWIDAGNAAAGPDASDTPFAIVPPLFRLDPRKGQSLRIIYLQKTLPTDRESVFWVNVLEVPPLTSRDRNGPENALQLAFRSRIKLFFRPSGMPGSAQDAPSRVSWRFVQKHDGRRVLTATNQTPYHVTFTRIEATFRGTVYRNDAGGMVAPGGTLELPTAGSPDTAGEPESVRYTSINDSGAGIDGEFHPKALVSPRP